MQFISGSHILFIILPILLQPLMLIVPDVQDVYTPLHSDIIVQLAEVCPALFFLTIFIFSPYKHIHSFCAYATRFRIFLLREFYCLF